MKFEKKLFCHYSYLHLVQEEDLAERDCVSLVAKDSAEMSIFLGKDDDNVNQYEVRIYKYTPAEHFVPNDHDARWCAFKANDEFMSLFFATFTDALHFLIPLRTLHPEYEAHYRVSKS